MKKYLLTAVLSACILFSIAGCDKEQMQKIDKAAELTKQTTEIGQDVLDSPIGGLVPTNIRFMITLAGALVLAIANGWQAWRKQQTQKALEEIVLGNEMMKDNMAADYPSFVTAQNQAQSITTRKMVSEIRKEINAE